MRSRNVFFVIALIAAATTVAFLAGCSKDSATAPAAVDDGGLSLASAEFDLIADSLVSQFATTVGIVSDAAVPFMDTSIAIAYSSVNPDSVVVEGAGWHVVYAEDIVAGYTRYLVDSIQFRGNGHVQPDAHNADEVAIVRHWGVNNPDTTGSYRNVEVNSVFVISGLKTQTATVLGWRVGTVETKIATVGTTVKRTIDMETHVADWAVVKGTNGFHSGCPQSGTITSTIDVTVDRGEIPITTSWQYNVTAENGTLTGTVTAGSVEKTYTRDVCTM
jgi:hypothetical protein